VGRVLARSILILALAVPAFVSTAPPCAACSCAPRSPERVFRRADAAFVGSVVGQQALDQVTTVQSFAVRSVFKGPLGATVDVIEPIGSGGGNTCGILFGPGDVAVILYRKGDGWTTDVCSRITVAELTRVGPPPVHPAVASGSTATPTATVSQHAGSGVGWRATAVGLLTGIAAIALMLSVASRRGRSPATSGAPATGDRAADDPSEAGPSG
jgi:hypothetical protein